MDGAEYTLAAKEDLRAELSARRRARTPEQLELARAAIRRTAVDRAAGFECVAAYLPLRTEPGSVELLAALDARGTRVLVPVTLPDRDLDWVRWPAEADAPAERLGRDAIGAAGLVLVPALAVALTGARLGRGGGSYDRALQRIAPAAQIVALVFEDEVRDTLPTDPWDVPVSAAITPSGWVELRGNADFPSPR